MSDANVRGKRALIVDDNLLNLELLRFVLEAAGWEVRTAGDSVEARAALAEQLPDVVLMDLGLPGVSGLNLTRQLRSEAATASLPIVAVTAAAMKGDEAKAIEAGCDGYIAKPIDTRTFVSDMEAVLSRRLA